MIFQDLSPCVQGTGNYDLMGVPEFYVEDGLAPSTISRHLSNLWLLGGEIISKINFDPPLRRKKAATLLADTVDETGGPYSRHLHTEAEMQSFDATCKKLHKYLRARHDG